MHSGTGTTASHLLLLKSAFDCCPLTQPCITSLCFLPCRDWAALAQHYDDLVCSQKQAADAAKRDIERQVLAFQQTRQGHHTGSEWDLNRPDRFLLDSPAR